MNEFDFYIKEGKVKKQRADTELAKSLIKDAEDRFKKVYQLDINLFSKIIFENIYDAIREILDALLAIDGYKSYSHEASIAYLKKLNIEDSIIREIDEFRFERNSSKYYGKDVLVEDVEGIIKFYNNHCNKIIVIIKNRIGAKK